MAYKLHIVAQISFMQEGIGLKIFLFDEDMFSLAIYEQYLKNIGCTKVRSFSSIVECVSRFDDRPQVIILDYRTRPGRGLKILTAIKKIIPSAYIVFITGPSGIIESLFSLNNGAFEYIIKDENCQLHLESVLRRVEKLEQMSYKKP